MNLDHELVVFRTFIKFILFILFILLCTSYNKWVFGVYHPTCDHNPLYSAEVTSKLPRMQAFFRFLFA